MPKKIRVYFIIFVIANLLVAVFWGSQKVNYYVDEVWTYGLANNNGSIYPDIEDGTFYQGLGVFEEFVTVNESETFDYRNVWENQASDVHPPLYYILIHTICSIFPGKFSKWFGIIPNLLCMVLIDYLLFLLSNKITGKPAFAMLIVVIHGLSVGFMNMLVFIRMYALMTVFVLLLTNLACDYLCKAKDLRFWIRLYVISLGGIMTHYYFLICLFFIVLFMIGHDFVNKNYRVIRWWIASLGLVGISCLIIFPGMLGHILGAGRGREAFHNALVFGRVWQNIGAYVGIIDCEMFGGFLVLWVILLGVAFYLKTRKKRNDCKSAFSSPYVMLLFTGICYILVIAQIAPYQVNRYVMAIYWLLVLVVVVGVAKIVSGRIALSVVVAIFLISNIVSLYRNQWSLPYTYTRNDSEVEIAKQYEACTAVYFYDSEDAWKIMWNMMDLQQYSRYVFVDVNDMDMLKKCMDEDRLIIYIDKNYDDEKTWDKICDTYGSITNVEYLFTKQISNTYLVNLK